MKELRDLTDCAYELGAVTSRPELAELRTSASARRRAAAIPRDLIGKEFQS